MKISVPFALFLTISFLGVVALGMVHVVVTDGQGTKLCPKESWSLTSTFVNIDEVVGRNKFELIDRAPLLRALERCRLISFDGTNRP